MRPFIKLAKVTFFRETAQSNCFCKKKGYAPARKNRDFLFPLTPFVSFTGYIMLELETAESEKSKVRYEKTARKAPDRAFDSR